MKRNIENEKICTKQAKKQRITLFSFLNRNIVHHHHQRYITHHGTRHITDDVTEKENIITGRGNSKPVIEKRHKLSLQSVIDLTEEEEENYDEHFLTSSNEIIIDDDDDDNGGSGGVGGGDDNNDGDDNNGDGGDDNNNNDDDNIGGGDGGDKFILKKNLNKDGNVKANDKIEQIDMEDEDIDHLLNDSQISNLSSSSSSSLHPLSSPLSSSSLSSSLSPLSSPSLSSSSIFRKRISLDNEKNELKDESRSKHYYLNNFMNILETVIEKDYHLFYYHEKDILHQFKSGLCEQCQRLLIRLYSRKGPWFSYSVDLKQKYEKELLSLGTMGSKKNKELHSSGIQNNDEGQHVVVLVDEDTDGEWRNNGNQDIDQSDSIDIDYPNANIAVKSNVNLDKNVKLLSFDDIIQTLVDTKFLEYFDPQKHDINEEFLSKINTIQLKCLYQRINHNVKKKDIPTKKDLLIQSLLKSLQKYNMKGTGINKDKNQILSVNTNKQSESKSIMRRNDVNVADTTNECARHTLNQQTLHKFIKISQLEQKIPRNTMTPQRFYQMICEKEVANTKYFVKINHHVIELFKRLHRLFFMNNKEKSEIMILETLRVVNYPTYCFKPLSMFSSREELNEYETAIDIENKLYELLNDSNNKRKEGASEELLSLFQQAFEGFKQHRDQYRKNLHTKTDLYVLRFRAGWIYCRCCHEAVNVYETLKMYDNAITILREMLCNDNPFCVGKRGKWWNRLMIDLQHVRRSKSHTENEIIQTCCNGLKDQEIRMAYRISLEKKLERLAKGKWGLMNEIHANNYLGIQKKLQPAKQVYIRGRYPQKMEKPQRSSKKSVFISYSKPHVEVFVEQLALEYYRLKYGLDGLHSEGNIFVTIFGLLFWDIIFDDTIPGVFQTKYQDAPLDLHTDAFYINRRGKIESRLQEIQEDDTVYRINHVVKPGEEGDHTGGIQNKGFIIKLLETHYVEHMGEQCQCVNWSKYDDMELLIDVCKSVRGPTLSKICRMFAEDYRNARSGMPDLILFTRSNQTHLDKTMGDSVHQGDAQNYKESIDGCKVVVELDAVGHDEIIRNHSVGMSASDLQNHHHSQEYHSIFSEVKGPRDRLSDKQIVWIDVLLSTNATVEVCHVVAVDEEKGNKKSQNQSTTLFDDEGYFESSNE